jgi:hypothetical protein
VKRGHNDVPEVDGAGAKRPTLVEVSGGGAERPQSEARRGGRLGRSGRLSVLLALLLLLAVAGLLVQSHRAGELAGEVAALASQVEVANRRLAAYEAQRERVRDALGGVVEDLSVLHELVSEDPLAVSEPAEAP